MICRGELFRVELGRRQAVLERRASLGGGVELCRTGGRHAGEPVQALRVERSQSGHADDAEDAFRQQRTACQGVGAATGMAHYRELPDAQCIGDA